jgi:predicted TIM-barrel fold metal-dependent hydrolase
MARVDVHQHFWPEPVIAALSRREEPPRLAGGMLELREGSFDTDLSVHDVNRRLELLDHHEIDQAVVSFPPTMGFEEAPDLAEAYDESILEVAAASGGRLRPLACGAEREGFVGTCVSAERVAREAHAVTGSLLFVHPGYAPAPPRLVPPWWNAIVHYTAVMESAYAAWIASRRSDVPVIFAIMAGGAPFQLERFRSRGETADVPPNVYFDTASYGRRVVDLTIEGCGADRVVFGSDAPVMDPGATIEALGDRFETAAANSAALFA